MHGLTPTPAVLGIRATFQFLWAWAAIANGISTFTPFKFVLIILVACAYLFIAVEVFLVLFAKGRSMHDRVLHTRVVLDAAPQRVA